MPNKPRKFCAAYPCRNLAVNGAYCAEHRPAAPAKETDPFYLSDALPGYLTHMRILSASVFKQ